MQVSDVEQNIGLMQTENIAIQAEGYDVAMDISFPKGNVLWLYMYMYV